MNILRFFDALHPEPTWAPWRTFVAAVYGEPLDTEGLELFRQCTARTSPRPGGYPEAVVVVGVQSGKTKVGTTLGDHAALTGERGTHAILVGQDLRGAMRTLLRYAREPFETVEAFRAEVARDTVDSLELRNGVSLSAYPCKPSALRGIRACIVVVDELAFFMATDGRPVDTEMLRVARGRLATTGGKLVILSSPYSQTGALHDLHRKHHGRDESDVLVWQASAPVMNPTLPANYLQRMELEDPAAYQSEVLGEFRAGVSTLLDPDALAECVDVGVRERPPVAGVEYLAEADAASGSGKDSFAVAIGHAEGDRAVLDLCRAWRPPFSPAAVIAEASDLLRRYNVRTVEGDKYAPGFVLEAFRRSRITYRQSDRDTSAKYLDLVGYVNTGSLRLLDDVDLLRELRGLERRRGPSGRDRVDHRPGAHDDRAVVTAGILTRASAPRPKGYQMIGLSAFGPFVHPDYFKERAPYTDPESPDFEPDPVTLAWKLANPNWRETRPDLARKPYRVPMTR